MMSPNTAITFSPIRVQNPRSGPWRKTHHTLTTSFTCMPTSWSSTTFESKPISAFRSIVTTEHMNKQAIPLKFSQKLYNWSFLFLGNVVLIPSSSVLTAARQDPSPIWCQPSSQLTTSLTDSTWSRSVSKTDCLCTHQTTKHVMTCHSHSLFLWFFLFFFHFLNTESCPAVPVLFGPGAHCHVSSQQQQPVPGVFQESPQGVPAKGPVCVSLHRWPVTVPLHKGQGE